jgi:hypothetical protein
LSTGQRSQLFLTESDLKSVVKKQSALAISGKDLLASNALTVQMIDRTGKLQRQALDA